MSRAHPPDGRSLPRERKREREYDSHPALTPLVIDLIPDETRAEIETAIDAPLVVEREAVWEDRDGEREESHSFTIGSRRQRHRDTASDTGAR